MPERLSQSRFYAFPVWMGVGCGVLAITLFLLQQHNVLLLLGLLLLGWISGQLCKISQTLKERTDIPPELSQLLKLARDPELADVHSQLIDCFVGISTLRDPIFRQLASQRLASLLQQAETLSAATIEYSSTESWRVAYEELLRSPGLHLYRSVAYIESAHYWQDGPGQQSTKLNLELQESRTISIERTAIIADHLWPESELFPMEPIHGWLNEQYRHGIWVQLVRESVLGNDLDLLSDLGIYGNRAIGQQVADPAGRTLQFVLSFDFDKVEQAEAMWSRLSVYAVSFRDLLDQQH